MSPDREYVYQFRLDAAQAKREAGQIARIFNTALRDIELKPKISIGNLNQVQQSIQKQLTQTQGSARTPAALDPYKAQLQSAKLLREEIKDREKEEKQNLAILNSQTSELKMQEALLTKREISLRRQARDAQAIQLGMNPGAFRSIRNAPVPGTPPRAPVMGGGLMQGIGQLQNLASFSIGGYAVTQMVSATLEAGKLGAENMRLARSYELLAKGAGLTASTLANKLSGAVQQTVTQQKLMASTNMLLAASQDGQIKVTEAQITTLAKFARLRSTQLTANGRPMSTEEAYGRLIQGTVKRETELLDELGLSTKAMADQLGVPLKDVNKDVESLLSAITKVAQIEIDRFGEPIVDEATRIEQAATRIEEAKNRINAALAGPTAWAYETGAYVTEQMTFGGTNQYKNSLLADRQKSAAMFTDRGNKALSGGEEFKRMAQLLRDTDMLMKLNRQGADALAGSVANLATEMANSAYVTDEQRAKLRQLETQAMLTANGGIVFADAMNEAERAALRLAAAQDVANASFAQAQTLLKTLYNGNLYVNLPTVGLQPSLGPTLPSDDYMRQRSIMQGGGFLTPGGANMGDVRGGWQEKWRQQNEQATKEGIREREQAEKDAIRESEQAWKSAANATERAFKDAASELESSIKSIPGLFGRSDVTKEQGEMAKLGVAQNFADNYLRRLTDEVLNGVDWEGVSLTDAASRAGIDQKLDPKAQLAIFSQKWADQSLFANASNLDLFDQDAIRAEMDRQRQSKLGQENIMGMFGLGKDEEGNTVFKDLGGLMAGGMKAGAEEGLAEFGRDAIANTMMQLKSDAALVEYASLGATMSDAMFGGFIEGTTKSDLVGAITAAVMRQINDYLDGAP